MQQKHETNLSSAVPLVLECFQGLSPADWSAALTILVENVTRFRWALFLVRVGGECLITGGDFSYWLVSSGGSCVVFFTKGVEGGEG